MSGTPLNTILGVLILFLSSQNISTEYAVTIQVVIYLKFISKITL